MRKAPKLLSKGFSLEPIVVVGADAAASPSDASSSSTDPTPFYFAGGGAALGIGVGLLTGAGAVWTVLLTVFGGAVGYVAGTMQMPSTELKCPDPTSDAFKTIVSDVASGKTDSKTAENIAKSYDNASCPAAAAAVRAAVPAPGGGKTVIGPGGKPPGGIPLIGGGGKPTIGSGYVSYKLTADDAKMDVASFRMMAGYATDDDFLHANAAIALYAPKPDGWPPPIPFVFKVPVGDPESTDFHIEQRNYAPTGRFSLGANVPTYIEKETGREIFFPSWHGPEGSAFGARSTSNGGQRMGIERGVWAWDEGMVVNVVAGSPVTKKAAA